MTSVGKRSFVRHFRIVLPAIDQGITSVGNLAISVTTAGSSTTAIFGSFALLYSIYWLTVGFGRALVGETALAAGVNARQHGIECLSIALVLGSVGAIAASLLGAFTHNEFLTVGGWVILPLTLQDVSRYVAFSVDRPHIALIGDATMLGLQLGTGLLVRNITGRPDSWILGWGLAALASGILIIAMVRPSGSARHALRWLRGHAKLAKNVAAEFWLNTGTQQFIVFFLPIVASLSALGALKGAQVAVGPLNVLLTSLSLVVLPSMFRRPEAASLMRILVSSMAVVVLAAVVYYCVVLLIPTAVMVQLLGPTWRLALPLMPLIVSQTVFNGVSQVGSYALRALALSRSTVAIRGILLLPTLALPLLGGAFFQARGAAIGLLIGSTVFSMITVTVTFVNIHRKALVEQGG